MNARVPNLPLDAAALQSHVDAAWSSTIVPELQRYIEVPAKSPSFDPEWATHGLLERVLQSAADWVARGEYLVRITGCNDCHTPAYGDRGGNVPKELID